MFASSSATQHGARRAAQRLGWSHARLLRERVSAWTANSRVKELNLHPLKGSATVSLVLLPQKFELTCGNSSTTS
jgi:hypothetical protein